jgi:hypothetical protein
VIDEAKGAKEVTAVDYRNSPSIVEGDDLKHYFFFPPTHLLSFDTHIVGVDCYDEEYVMDFAMSNSSLSNIL